ncbi:piggyBac transposable element-derived protein 3-like [Onthophagus taurus]|uniref:piggyBac transposable element-derived protein 3-like n=1 Tax=Onthophagus taurus TaxID=166361 RepID=UPI0039BEAB07
MNCPQDIDIAGTYEVQVPNADEYNSSDDEFLAVKQRRLMKEKENRFDIKWKKSQIDYTHSALSIESLDHDVLQEKLVEKTPLELFFLYFHDEMLNLIINFSLKYADDNNRPNFRLDKEQLLKFLGIVLLSGYHTLPTIPMFWSNEEDKGVEIVKKIMSRNTFQNIKRNLYLSDNSLLDPSDKFAKIRAFLQLINKKKLQFGVFSHNLFIDEQMVPYFGRHSCKMFIKGKPVRFGFKLWCLCSSDGYLFHIEPYAGAAMKTGKSKLGLGGEVVMQLLPVVKNPHVQRIFFDNLFSSFDLFVELKNKGFFATGTVRDNRTKNCPLENIKCTSKKERGFFDTTYDTCSKISLVRWKDNSVVTVITNHLNVEPIQSIKRCNRKKKKGNTS